MTKQSIWKVRRDWLLHKTLPLPKREPGQHQPNPSKVNNVYFETGGCYAGALPTSDTVCTFEQPIVRSRQPSPGF
jgi:hypothetical protein